MGKTHTNKLGQLNDLFRRIEAEIQDTIGNLSPEDLRGDDKFAATINKIKAHATLIPVVIGEPSIKSHRQERRDLGATYLKPTGGEQLVNVVTVTFPVTGSRELFQNRPNSGTLTIGNIYVPDYDSISMEVVVMNLDKNQVIAKAADEISVTRELIGQNNPKAQAWSQQIEPQIEEACIKKRTELNNFYS